MVSKTELAFSTVRANIGQARLPRQDLIRNPGQVVQMTTTDGLMQWVDGKYLGSQPAPEDTPVITAAQLKQRMLWVVQADNVAWAPEHGEFGKTLESKAIKHTNLTGGAAAFSGGELLVLEDDLIIINGSSGRYGPKSATELNDVLTAFAQSGYAVWAMGYDTDAGLPLPFYEGAIPTWVP